MNRRAFMAAAVLLPIPALAAKRQPMDSELDALAKRSFIGFHSTTKNATKYSLAQLWNPSGSGKKLLLSEVSVDSSEQLLYFGVELIVSTTAIAALNGYAKNKYLGASDSTAELRTDNITSYPSGNIVGVPQVEPHKMASKKFSRPIVIPPGYGVTAAAEIFNIQMCVTWEFVEVPD